jgi:ribosomal protein S18 acetylase RimI-like enzyme
VIIRPAELADARKVAEIHVATWKEAYRGIVPDEYLQSLSVEKREAAWRESLEKRLSELWVASESTSELAGWVSFGGCRDSDKPVSAGELWAIYVSPRYWSCGVGRALWLTARNRLVELRFTEVTAWCLAGNDRAERFYRAAGFLPTNAIIKATFANVILDEIRYEAVLSP